MVKVIVVDGERSMVAVRRSICCGCLRYRPLA